VIKFIRKHERPQIAKAILSKISNAGAVAIPDFKLYDRATTIKTAWYWPPHRQEDQWIRIEDPDINPRIYIQLIFDKRSQNTQWKKDSFFNKCCLEHWKSTYIRLKLGNTGNPHIQD
jgi:uncharacterized protein (DUF736 family)